jgi:hypothetical protein
MALGGQSLSTSEIYRFIGTAALTPRKDFCVPAPHCARYPSIARLKAVFDSIDDHSYLVKMSANGRSQTP